MDAVLPGKLERRLLCQSLGQDIDLLETGQVRAQKLQFREKLCCQT
jgi:hypothetical protein